MKIYDKNDTTVSFDSIEDLWEWCSVMPCEREEFASEEAWDDYMKFYEALQVAVKSHMGLDSNAQYVVDKANELMDYENGGLRYFMIESEG